MELINGLIVSGVLELAKRADSFPLTADEKGKIRVIGFGLSIVATLVVGFATGNLQQVVQSADFGQLINGVTQLLFTSLGTWFTSVISYHSLIK